ncbi:MAG: SDR family NAD(P)-dependent oxidoreductase [Sphingobacteriia bacterium]|nr:SDR family NAD(P)-dependent oxidoreductase [Sphingobacteriia bacterium]
MKHTYILLGATNGFGLETGRLLALAADTIVIAARNKDKGEQIATNLKKINSALTTEVILCDLADKHSVDLFIKLVKTNYSRIDAIMNNAGAVLNKNLKDKTGYSLNTRVNFISPAQICLGLESLLVRESVIVNTVSVGEHIGNLNFSNLKESLMHANYAQAKKALLLFTLALNRKWNKQEIYVRAFHPKVVLPMEDKPRFIKYLLYSTISSHPLKVAISLSTLILNPGLEVYQTLEGEKAKISKQANNLDNQAAVFNFITSNSAL